jgi:hypothetical protein
VASAAYAILTVVAVNRTDQSVECDNQNQLRLSTAAAAKRNSAVSRPQPMAAAS